MKKGLVFNRAMSAHPNLIRKHLSTEPDTHPIVEAPAVLEEALQSTTAFESVRKRVQSAVGALVKHRDRAKQEKNISRCASSFGIGRVTT